MAGNRENRPLKVCSTCRYWTYKYKGLCTHLNQGVGKFWVCADWMAADDDQGRAPSAAEASAPPSP